MLLILQSPSYNYILYYNCFIKIKISYTTSLRSNLTYPYADSRSLAHVLIKAKARLCPHLCPVYAKSGLDPN